MTIKAQQRVFLCFGTVGTDHTAAASAMAEMIGRALAKRGYSVIHSGNAAVPGACAAKAFSEEVGDEKQARKRLTSYLPKLSLSDGSPDLGKEYIGLGTSIYTGHSPESRRHIMVLDSDIIIAMGGRRAVAQNLALAERLGRPVVPIAAFGGTTAEVGPALLRKVERSGDPLLVSLYRDVLDRDADHAVIAESAVCTVELLLERSDLTTEVFGNPQRELPVQVFLSYSSKNKQMIRKFYNVLKEIGHKPWLDDMAITAGMDPVRAIQRAFHVCDAAIFFLTGDFADERWIQMEIDCAVRRRIESGDAFPLISIRFAEDVSVPQPLEPYAYKTVSSELDALFEVLRALRVIKHGRNIPDGVGPS
jgi:hypothetical protein